MSGYQGYPHGQGPGGHDEGRALTPRNTGEQYTQIKTDPLVMAPMSRVMSGGGETYNRHTPYSGEDFTDEEIAWAPKKNERFSQIKSDPLIMLMMKMAEGGETDKRQAPYSGEDFTPGKRAWAPRNTDDQYSHTEADPLMAPVSQAMPSDGETYKRPAQYSGEDSADVSDAKRSCFETRGLPVKGQDDDWMCDTVDPADRSRTYYVFNLMLKTTTSDLFDYFVNFGDLTKFDVFTNHEGKSTGTGIVQYVNEEDAVAALAARPHFIHKKRVIISHDREYDPKTNQDVKWALEKFKLYVADIPLDVPEEALCEYFSQWGNIAYCDVADNAKRTRKAKYGFVSFASYEDAVKCLNATHHYGKSVIDVFVAGNCKALRGVVKAKGDIREKMNQLFVTNIPDDITPEEFTEHFSMWGKLDFCKIGGKVKRNNNFGFVCYLEQEDALTALIMPHTLKHQRVFVQVSERNGGPLLGASKDTEIMSAVEQRVKNCYLYVPNLNARTNKDELFEHFKKYGDLASCITRPTGKNEIMAFLAYIKEADALHCHQDVHFMNDVQLNVRWSHLTKWGGEDRGASQKSDAGDAKPAGPRRFVRHADPHRQNRRTSPLRDDRAASPPRQNRPASPLRHNSHDIPPRHTRPPSPARHDRSAGPLRYARPASPPRHPRPARDVALVRPTYSGMGHIEAYESPKSVAPAQPAGFARPVIRARPTIPAIPTIPALPAYPVSHKAEPPNRKLEISGLAAHTAGYTLMCYFSRWGRVEDFELVTDASLKPSGCAFVMFEKHGDAEKAVSDKPHVIDDKEVKVTYAKPHEKLPSESFLTWREQRHHETAQQQRLPESIKSLDQGCDAPEAREPQRLLEDAQPQKLPEDAQSRRLFEDAQSQRLLESVQAGRSLEDAQPRKSLEDAQPRRLLEDPQPRRLLEDAQPRRLLENAQPRGLLEDAQPQRLCHEVYQPRRQSTPDPLMSRLTQVDSVPDMPLVTEYECNVPGCLFKGKSELFERHWTKIHKAKVLYLICSFCSMECVDADDLCEHLDFFHGIEDRSELSTYLRYAKQQERDNVQFIKPGSVTRETCMKLIKPPLKKDARDIVSSTECSFTGILNTSTWQQAPVHSQISAQSQQACVVASPHPQVVAPSIVPLPSSQAGAPLQHPVTGQMVTQSASAQLLEFVMEPPPVASQSVLMPGEDPNSIPKLNTQDSNNFEIVSIKTQEKENIQEMSCESQSEPEIFIENKLNNELKRSVQPGLVLVPTPEWTKSLQFAHPSKSPNQHRIDNGGPSKRSRRDNCDQLTKERQQRTEKRGQASKDLQQRTGNGDRSRNERQQRTEKRGQAGKDLQQRTGNGDRSRKERQQRIDNYDHLRNKHQRRTENRGQSCKDLQHWTEDNLGRSREEFRGRRDWNMKQEEHVEVYMDEYVNEGEEYALAYIDEDGVHVMDDGFVMGEGGCVESEERLDIKTERELRSQDTRVYGGDTTCGHRNIDDKDMKMHDRGQDALEDGRFSQKHLEYRDGGRTSFSCSGNRSVSIRRNGGTLSSKDQMPRESVFAEEVEYFDGTNEYFVEEENKGFTRSERVDDLVNYDQDKGAFDTAWTKSAQQDDRILPGQGSSLGRVDGRLEGDRGFSNQYDSFKTDNAVTRGSQGRGYREHSRSSSADKSVRRTGKERNRGWEIPESAKHFRKHDSMKRGRKDFIDGGTTKSPSKDIDDRYYHSSVRNQYWRDKADRSKTKSQHLKKDGFGTKNKDQMNSGQKKKTKGGDKTEGKEGNICELDKDDIDMGDFDMSDFVVMDAV